MTQPSFMFESGSEDTDAISIVFNALSFFSCLIACYLHFEQSFQHHAPLKAVFYLIFSNLMVSIAGICAIFRNTTAVMCNLSLFLSLMAYWSTAFWCIVIAIFSYKILVKTDTYSLDRFINWMQYLWIITCIVLPLIPILQIPGVKYTVEDGTCGISFLSEREYLIILIKGAPFLSILLATVASYIKQLVEIRRVPRPIRNIMNLRPSPIFWYPILQSLCLIPGLICEALYLKYSYSSLLLNAIRLYFDQTAGFTISVMYILQKIYIPHFQSPWFGTTSPKLVLPIISSSDEEDNQAQDSTV